MRTPLARRRSLVAVAGAGLVVAALGVAGPATAAPVRVSSYVGTLTDGAKYRIDVPAAWSGSVALFSHGYQAPGTPLQPQTASDMTVGRYLLNHGWAIAGSSYASDGWAIQQAVPDQLATLARVAVVAHRRPTRVVAWGQSLGGMVTAALVQARPSDFAGALPMCGVVAGGVGTWNQALDAAFTLKTVLAPADAGWRLVHITDPAANLDEALTRLAAAQATPAGRARIALGAALGQVPGWFSPSEPRPAPTAYATQEADQYRWVSQVLGPFAFALRAELEARAGGNPSWNVGVDYRTQLDRSGLRPEVVALYRSAGLDLNADLARLGSAARIAPDRRAVAYLARNVTFTGDLGGVPVLTVHTLGDGLVVPTQEQAYRASVGSAGDTVDLRQLAVNRAGHCAFTDAETVTAFQVLTDRISHGRWDVPDPAGLNRMAARLPAAFRPVPAAYATPTWSAFLRPWSPGDAVPS